MKQKLLCIYSKENIRGLNLAAVMCMTVQVSRLLL
jgi:hypothetical protein